MLPVLNTLGHVIVDQVSPGCCANLVFDSTYPRQLLQHVTPEEFEASVQRLNQALKSPTCLLWSNRLMNVVTAYFGVTAILALIYYGVDFFDLLLFSVSLCITSSLRARLISVRREKVAKAIAAENDYYANRYPQSMWHVVPHPETKRRLQLHVHMMPPQAHPLAAAHAHALGASQQQQQQQQQHTYVPPAFAYAAPAVPSAPEPRSPVVSQNPEVVYYPAVAPVAPNDMSRPLLQSYAPQPQQQFQPYVGPSYHL